MNYQEFQFVVEQMTPEQAEKLMDAIIAIVEGFGLQMGGGYHSTTDADYVEFFEEAANVQAP